MHSLLPFSSYQWMDYVDTTNPWHVKEGPTLVGPYHVTFYMAVLHVQGASPPLKWSPFSWFLIHLAVALWLSISKKTKVEGGGLTKGLYVTTTKIRPLRKIVHNIFPRVNNNRIIHIIILQNTISNINYVDE